MTLLIIIATAGLGLALTAAFYRRPEWGLAALVAALPFERIGSWALNPVNGHPVVRLSQVIGAALVLALAVRWAMGWTARWAAGKMGRTGSARWIGRPMAPFWLLGAFVVWCGVSALVVGRPQLISGWVALVFAAALAWAVAALVPRINLARLQAALFASAGAVSLFGLYQFIGGAAGLSPALTGLRGAYTSAVFGFPRVQATALEPLYFANYLLIPLIIGLAMWALSPRRFPVWQRTVVLLAGLDFVLTMSRGAFIALAASLVLGSAYVLLKKQSLLTKIFNWRFLAASIIIIALGLGLVGAASWLSTGNFNRGPLQYIDFVTASLTKTASFTERAQMRQQAIDIWHAHPVLGVGIEGIGPYVHNYPAARTADDTVALNNQFLELLAESGIVGAALFYGFLAWLLIRAAIQLRDLRARHQVWLLGTAVALVALTIQAQSFSGFLLTHLWVVYGLLAGLTAHGSDQAPVREINSEI